MELMHRDDVPYQIVEMLEKVTDSKIIFPGDIQDELFHERVRQHQQYQQELFEDGKCMSCHRPIPNFNADDLKDITIENSCQWTIQEYLPAFGMFNCDASPNGIMCRECYDNM